MTGAQPPAAGDDAAPTSSSGSTPTPDASALPQPGWTPPGPQTPASAPPGWPPSPAYVEQPPTVAPFPPGYFPPPGSAPPDSTLSMPPQYPYQPAYAYPNPPQPPRKGRTGLIIGIVAAVVVVVLGGAAATVVIERNRLQPASGAGPSGSAQKDTPAVSPEEYQSALDAADQELAPLYAAMVGSKHPDELQTTAFALARAIEARSTALYAIKPPTAVAAAHQHLIEALGTFGAAVSSIGGAN